jgi:hypothetical protein
VTVVENDRQMPDTELSTETMIMDDEALVNSRYAGTPRTFDEYANHVILPFKEFIQCFTF